MSNDRNIRRQIEDLRHVMAEEQVSAYLVGTADFHDSEYAGPYFRCREFLTGFTGSAGTAVVTAEEAGLWTDGRYFVQAARELSGSGITLYRMGEPDVPTVEEFLAEKLKKGDVLGFDGRCISEAACEKLEKKLPAGVRFCMDKDLVGRVWPDRPALPQSPVWQLDEKYAGLSAKEKITQVRLAMKMRGSDMHVLTSLDDICWLLNLRGSDIPCTPVFLAFLIMTQEKIRLFADESRIPAEVLQGLAENGVETAPYQSFFEEAGRMSGHAVLLEKGRISAAVWRSLSENNALNDRINPTTFLKAVKNPVECENMRRCHRKDAVAMIRFLRWLEQEVPGGDVDEASAAAHLDKLRMEQEGCLGPSFDTISAYSDNAAMCHYEAPAVGSRKLSPRGLYLVDSGGQYLEGTTDITRTVALGPVTEEEKKYFTLVAVGFLRLMNARFREGVRGLTLDYAAREVLWKEGLDFNHGTGHGVGFLGVVHEGPQAIRFRVREESLERDNAPFAPGMVTSDEPGLYIEGKCGIRTENLLLCVPGPETAFGKFLEFEPLTLVPVDLSVIDVRWMSDEDIEALNRYHRKVYEEIGPLLLPEEQAWLRNATRNIER